MGNILWQLIIGLVIGVLARLIMPGASQDQPSLSSRPLLLVPECPLNQHLRHLHAALPDGNPAPVRPGGLPARWAAIPVPP